MQRWNLIDYSVQFACNDFQLVDNIVYSASLFEVVQKHFKKQLFQFILDWLKLFVELHILYELVIVVWNLELFVPLHTLVLFEEMVKLAIHCILSKRTLSGQEFNKNHCQWPYVSFVVNTRWFKLFVVKWSKSVCFWRCISTLPHCSCKLSFSLLLLALTEIAKFE